MTDPIVARAPGKLFLLGEYAVLDGCPAVVAAVGSSVDVRIAHDRRSPTVRVTAAGYGKMEFVSAEPPAAEGPLRFVTAAFRTVLRRYHEVGQLGLAIDVASQLDGPTGGKVGLGSSAAVTVASVAALLATTGRILGGAVDRHDVFSAALEAHHAAQGAVGSGADVAASTYGGLLLFEPRAASLPVITQLALPPSAKLLAAWSGEAAVTEGLVKHYLGASNGAAAERAAFVEASRTCVHMFVDALRHDALSLAAIDTNGQILECLADRLQLPLMTLRLRELVRIARKYGAAAKTSGAGNGDCGIAITQDAAAAGRIRAAWEAAGLVPLDIEISRQGVTVGDR